MNLLMRKGLPNIAALLAPVKRAEYRIRPLRSQIGQLLFQLVRMPYVVAVLKGDVLPLRLRNAAIPRRRRSAVLLAHIANPRIGDRRHHRRRIVRGRVVHHDQLQLGNCLLQHALNGAGQHMRPIVRRNNYADHVTPPFRPPHAPEAEACRHIDNCWIPARRQ